MKRLPKNELSPNNGCVIDTKWKLGPLGYHPSAAGKVEVEPSTEIIRLPELVIYDHIGFSGAYARLGPGYYESFFTEKGPDDVVSSFQAIALT